MDEEMEQGRRPMALVFLPDGQTVEAAVLRRRRDRAGRWWYDCLLEVPDRIDLPHGPRPHVQAIEFSALYPDYVAPLSGEDYSLLDPPPPAERKRWRIERPAGSGPDYVVHRADCASAAHAPALATDREVFQLLAGPDETVTCAICRPEAVLRGYGS
ncbi:MULTISPECIES: DUF6233 domain-containing protein [Streptomyces]|uniref:DUF6233 domain-containing protein n=1 Tax=Streptomyces TaxID=1883 RepID=UPI00163CA6C7|nr:MULTISPECIES: DUF6233 domain-containing protein [Streptomyces]MBC2879809.1 hypothetical protein [Streptomyces sp. TYQ1024]UBI41415.1 DUF6233 domain-containing protein [Streptomyces mobaraensis]